MSERNAIKLTQIGKMYKMYPSRIDNVMDAFGLSWLTPRRRRRTKDFWALRGVDLEVKAGTRLGIIGRNGAGKSTLLKLMTLNKIPTEGKLEVNGQVQALLEAGAGFHPEFTGYENIRASLTYQGLEGKEIEAAIGDIAEFTELGQFLSQPFKTYSAGMQARLTFATATVLNPDILIVDEILGAGDAYFAGKSLERMKNLVESSGATVLIVSHALDQVLRYCDECIWIERGKIVMRGSSLEVVKAYEKFVRDLEERRIKSQNYKRSKGDFDSWNLDFFNETIRVSLDASGMPGESCDISEIQLLRNGQAEDTISVGDVQDTNWSQTSVVSLSDSDWSDSEQEGDCYYRSILIPQNQPQARGTVVFYSYALYENAVYTFKIRYRCCNSLSKLSLNVSRNNVTFCDHLELPTDDSNWREWISAGFLLDHKTGEHLEDTRELPRSNGEQTRQLATKQQAHGAISHWPGEGSIVIENVQIGSSDILDRVIFAPGDLLRITITAKATETGGYEVIPNVVFYTRDGIRVSCHIGNSTHLEWLRGQKKEFVLSLPDLNLGDGEYVISVALYKTLDPTGLVEKYDLIDRSYAFKVIGNDPYKGIFEHPSTWSIKNQ
jgi:lipopolysaccharide transport system ATP-binding protein